MNIDIKRLRVDAGYWAAVAPEWADSYGLAGVLGIPVWFNGFQYKHVGGVQVGHTFSFEEQNGYASKEIRIKAHRPEVQAPEWDGTGRPPVGAECEVLDRVSGKLNRVEITAVSRDHLVALFNGEEVLLKKNCQFRPIRTQARREREDLINAATEILNQDHVLTERDAAEALYDAGMLRGAGE